MLSVLTQYEGGLLEKTQLGQDSGGGDSIPFQLRAAFPEEESRGMGGPLRQSGRRKHPPSCPTPETHPHPTPG